MRRNNPIKLHANAQCTRNATTKTVIVMCVIPNLYAYLCFNTNNNAHEMVRLVAEPAIQLESINFRSSRCASQKPNSPVNHFMVGPSTSKVETADNNNVPKINSDLFVAIKAEIKWILCNTLA